MASNDYDGDYPTPAVNESSSKDWPDPLGNAVRKGDISTVAAQLDNLGLNPTTTDRGLANLLFYACVYGRLDMLELGLNRGVALTGRTH